MNNNKILILPIEVKVREFIPKLYLAYNILKRTNIKIIIGGTRFLTNNINYENCIWLDKNTFPDFREKYPIHKKNYVIMLDEEGPISFHTKEEKKERYQKGLLRQIKHFIYAGRLDLKYLDERFYKNNFSILGSVKFDLIKNKKIFSREVKEIKKKYKKFIFIPAHYNHFNNNKNIIKKYAKYESNIDTNLKKRLESIKKVQNNYYALIDFAIKLAKQNPDINIIFRKHPTEKNDYINDKFKDRPKNLKLIYKYTITPWIIACDYYLHGGCQSALEAAYLKKKIISYLPYKYRAFKNFKNFHPFFQKETEILKFFFKKKFKKVKFYKIKNLKEVAHNLQKNVFFYKGFISFLNKRFKNLQSSYSVKEKNSLRLFLGEFLFILVWFKQLIQNNSILSKFLPLFHLVSKDEKLQKFDNLTKYEVIRRLSMFNNISNSKKKIFVKKLSKATFMLYT